jgi:Zn finger protein HypA/HybF involved in hydrogenase expression
MVAGVFAGVNALKTAFDIAKGLKDLDDATRRNAAVIKLQEKILAAQSAQAELIEEVSNLKRRVAELEAWEAEKQRYELNEIGPGVFAYRLMNAMARSEPSHCLCAACYQRARKSILQRRDHGMEHLLNCPECKAQFKIGQSFV